MSAIWFTADTHFGHVNIVKHCHRPFESIEEHDRAIIDNWNERVEKGDRVYHLGDFGLPQGFDDARGYLLSILDELKGQIHFIRGNHDKLISGAVADRFVTDRLLHTVKVGKGKDRQHVVLCHYPFETWNRSAHGAWHLHGHCHGNLPANQYRLRMDAGVDCNDFAPVSYEQVERVMAGKVFKPVDHHGRR